MALPWAELKRPSEAPDLPRLQLPVLCGENRTQPRGRGRGNDPEDSHRWYDALGVRFAALGVAMGCELSTRWAQMSLWGSHAVFTQGWGKHVYRIGFVH